MGNCPSFRRVFDKQICDTVKQLAQVFITVGHAEHSGDLRRYVASHDHAIREKAEIMVDHFHAQVIGHRKIGSQARAIGIANGIERAIQYFHAFKDYLKECKSPYAPIVADKYQTRIRRAAAAHHVRGQGPLAPQSHPPAEARHFCARFLQRLGDDSEVVRVAQLPIRLNAEILKKRICMIAAFIAVAFGLALLVWSADRFVEGSASTACHFGMPPLMIGMVIVGFGTSAPEMVVSALAASQGNPGIAVGNAYGSNITNIALILGLTALIRPIAVHSQVLRKELPILTTITALAAWQLWDGEISRIDAFVLLGAFGGLMAWSIWQGMQKKADALGREMEQELEVHIMPIRRAIFWLVIGLIVLIVSSRILVWGAVEIAQGFGVSDLIIGLTIVAVGTSLPELASSIIATRKGEHDIALGNVLGSNLFNTLAVVGIAGMIHPITVGPEVFSRDILVMATLTVSLFVIGYGVHGLGRINRFEGGALLLSYVGYTAYLASTVFGR
ncbi:hypothetical protein DAMNIGENAA_02170 [Desulforhabdus amnigena]|uniref:Sodium/calcium exchanger membrane region domain-containing protein n=2 Tax=Desulforhabdus amnigena TaxID=40218 RepID=A0A9W6D0K8_9BACT|nr:hypothetical protein DAMNIGENAA_02170 [Desulforhabdus amnigena]